MPQFGNRYGNLLRTYLKDQRRRFIVLAVLLFGSIGLQVFIPQITRRFIDAASNGQPSTVLMPVAVGFLALAIFSQVVSVAAAYLGEQITWTATNALRADLMKHCLHLDMSFHNNRTPGELIERIDSDVAQLANFFSQLVIQVVGNILLTIGILLALFLEDWRLGVAFTAFSLSVFYMLNRVRNVAVPAEKVFRQANAELSGFLEEHLAGTEDIRSSGAVDYIMNRLYQLQHTIRNKWLAAWRKQVIIHIVSGLALTLGYAVAFSTGYSLYTAGLITIGTAYLIMNYMLLLDKPFFELAQQIDSLQSVVASVDRIEELLRIQPSIKDGTRADLTSGALSLVFENVSFCYSPDQPVLNSISFSLQPGEVLGVLGRTGSGKTSLARLILRLYDPTRGSIRLNNIDLHDLQLATLHQHVGMITQDVQLFDASLRNNLSLFDPDIPDSHLIDAIQSVGLQDWYILQSDGLATPLQANGKNLSAGEAQLLAFARVFLHNSGLIILDEASSRLDPATEARIEQAIDKLLQNRTAVIIAHRLNTLNRADKILILEQGQIVEYGDRSILAADPESRFNSLLKTSQSGVIA